MPFKPLLHGLFTVKAAMEENVVARAALWTNQVDQLPGTYGNLHHGSHTHQRHCL